MVLQNSVEIIGESKHLHQIKEKIDYAAKENFPVLIQGPTGTGKELIANAIHLGGARKDKPFVPVDCGAIAPQLFESELFGHIKGAFTGARSDKKRLVEIANEGTLFLDEIGNLRLDHQGKLLRFLQDGTYRPVGSVSDKESTARVITASNKDLTEMVKNKTFWDDLYARVAGYTIQTVGLAKRPEGTICIANHLMRKKQLKVDPKVKFLLYSYYLPGNVRQLENLIIHPIDYIKGHLSRLWKKEHENVEKNNPIQAWVFDQVLKTLKDSTNEP